MAVRQLIEPEKLRGKVLVRVRGANRRTGMRLQRYSYQGMLFDAEQGWYAKDEALADALRDCVVNPGDPDSPFALEVVTPEEALRIQHREDNPVLHEVASLASEREAGPLPSMLEAPKRDGDGHADEGFDRVFGRGEGGGPALVTPPKRDDRVGGVETEGLAPMTGRDMEVGRLPDAEVLPAESLHAAPLAAPPARRVAPPARRAAKRQ